MWFLILVAFISLLVYLSIFKVNTYWTRKCVPQLTPLPLIGNMGSIILRKKEVSDITQDIYNSFPNSRYIGIYQFRKPTLFVRDPELIRQITIKCFNNFPEHSLFNNDENDVPKNKGLFSLGGKLHLPSLNPTKS
uniref:Cytochrome P450 n=1 Tax=Photinus pyralis TaxID=7054 RepID=A0A1Y1M8I7_PHOPY